MGFQDKKSVVLSAAILVLLFPLLSVAQLVPYQYLTDTGNADGSLTFFSIGDWGRQGHVNQTQTAVGMGVVGAAQSPNFIIGTGDNFYENGVTTPTDPQYNLSFTSIYTAPSLQKQWYNVLGNRDYRGKVSAQIDPAVKTSTDPRWNCFQQYKLSAGLADFFIIDTTPSVPTYFTNASATLPAGISYDWAAMKTDRDTYLTNMLKTLDTELSKSTARWKIVVGHHPVWSTGLLGPTDYLVANLTPILEKYKVHVYLNGHDHDLQNYVVNGVNFITTGAGSQTDRGQGPWPQTGLKYYYSSQGFLGAKLTQAKGDFAFYDINGNVLYSWTIV